MYRDVYRQKSYHHKLKSRCPVRLRSNFVNECNIYHDKVETVAGMHHVKCTDPESTVTAMCWSS